MIPLYRLFGVCLHGPLYQFLPLLLSGTVTAWVLAVQPLIKLFSDRNQSFRQDQTISKEHLDET